MKRTAVGRDGGAELRRVGELQYTAIERAVAEVACAVHRPGAAIDAQTAEIDVLRGAQRSDTGAAAAGTRGRVLQDQRVGAASPPVDHAGLREAQQTARAKQLQSKSTSTVDAATGHCSKAVGAAYTHRHAAVDSARVDEGVAGGRTLKAHSPIDGAGIDGIDGAATAHCDYRCVRAQYRQAQQRTAIDRASVVDLHSAIAGRGDAKRHAIEIEQVDTEQTAGAVNRAGGKIVDGDRGGTGIPHGDAGAQHREQPERGGIDRAGVVERGVGAAQRDGGAAQQSGGHLRAGCNIHG